MGNSITEQKIKEAARKVFQKKGFEATRTRDIADEAGVNLALINYYYRSKESLFYEIIHESIGIFRNNLCIIMNDKDTTLQEKLQLIVENYYSIFEREPQLPMFIFHEFENKNEAFINEFDPHGIIHNSYFEKQLNECGKSNDEVKQIFMNTVSLIIFPFLGNAVAKKLCGEDNEGYKKIMEQRKQRISQWIITMFNL